MDVVDLDGADRAEALERGIRSLPGFDAVTALGVEPVPDGRRVAARPECAEQIPALDQ